MMNKTTTVTVTCKAMTFAEAKEKFLGMPLVVMSPEVRCNSPEDDEYWECEETCSCDGCPYHVDYDLALEVRKVFSTRRSFLLQTAVGMFVVSKKDAADFSLEPVEVSESLREQIENTGLELEEEEFFFCRTWSGRTRRYFQGKYDCTFIYPCEREKANCLVVVTRNRRYCSDDLRKEEAAYGGKCDYVHSCHDGECGDAAMDLWRFQYDPESDGLVVPGEELDQSIDEMVERLEQ